MTLAHGNRSDFCDLRLRCPSRTPEIVRFPRQEKAMLHCDLRVRWKVASDLRFRAAISESKTPFFCGISGDLAPSTRKSLAIAIVRFWCAKHDEVQVPQQPSFPQGGAGGAAASPPHHSASTTSITSTTIPRGASGAPSSATVPSARFREWQFAKGQRKTKGQQLKGKSV